MKRLAQVISLALLLQVLVPAQYVGLSQTTFQSHARDRTPVKSQTAGAGRYAQQIKIFDEFAGKQMAIDHTPGLTIGFMKDDVVWVKGYGYADLENKTPAKAESAYRLGSVAKSMTAVAIMQLVEKGKINLDAEVQTYVPYFPKKQWPVTVRQLLGHLGGISHYKNPAAELHFKDHKSTREAIAVFENFDLVAEPGTRYSYSSYGYNLLGAVVEAASGLAYGDYMRQNVWGPLGMSDTRMDDPLDLIPNRVRGYQLVNGKVKNSEAIDISSRFGAGGARSTVPDLLKYASGVMGEKLLSGDSMNVVTASMSTREGRLTNYGMGWETSPYNGRYMLVHSGGQQETTTLLYLLPSRKMAIAVAMNFEGSNPAAYTDRLFQLLTGSPLALAVYSSDKNKAALAEAINSAFNYGQSYFERKRQPLSSDRGELAEAFAYFNSYVNPEALKASPQETIKKIREGAHPVAKQAFTQVGSWMAARLREKHGQAKLDAYPELGGLAFFQDYIALTSADATSPKEFRFNDAFAQVASEMARDWSKADSDYVRALWLTPDADFDLVGKALRQSFAGASVYPNLVDSLFGVTRQLILNRDLPRALKAGQLAAELYPEAPAANFANGIALVLSGDLARGQASLKKAATLNPSGAASAVGLNNVAYQLAGVGLVDEAVTILQAAIELYPKEANLFDSMGEFLLRKGDKAGALVSYKKALEINPNYPSANAAREMVRKLSSELGAQ